MDRILQKVTDDGVFFLFVESTRKLRTFSSRISALLVLFLYVINLYQVGYNLLLVFVGGLFLGVYYLSFFGLTTTYCEHLYPIAWCWCPLGLFFIHSNEIIFPFAMITAPEIFVEEDKIFVDLKLYSIHALNVTYLLLVIVYWRHCNLCTFPYYALWTAWQFFPQQVSSILPFFLAITVFMDTIHHYTSHHVNEYTFNNFTTMMFIFASLFLFLSGTYSSIILIFGVMLSLAVNIYPARAVVEIFIDPDSIIGLQLCFCLGQIFITFAVKLFSNPAMNMWGGVLKGLILGRALLLYTIQDEQNTKKALGKARLF